MQNSMPGELQSLQEQPVRLPTRALIGVLRVMSTPPQGQGL